MCILSILRSVCGVQTANNYLWQINHVCLFCITSDGHTLGFD